MSASEPPDVDRLRKALARLDDEPQWPDADAERVFDALHGEMSAEERRIVIEDSIRNPRAAAAWRLAKDLEPEGHARASGSTGMWKWMSLAAMLLLIVGAAWLQPWRSEAPGYRGGEARSITSLVAADARLSREQPVLRWTAMAGARYRVRVLTPDLDLLDEAEDLTAPEYRLKPEVVSRIPAGGRILWQVEARVPGTPAVVSPTFSVQLE